MQKTPSRCGTWGRTCHTVPISMVFTPAHPAGNGGVHSLSSIPTAAFCRKQPISTALPPHPPGEMALLRGLLLPSQEGSVQDRAALPGA